MIAPTPWRWTVSCMADTTYYRSTQMADRIASLRDALWAPNGADVPPDLQFERLLAPPYRQSDDTLNLNLHIESDYALPYGEGADTNSGVPRTVASPARRGGRRLGSAGAGGHSDRHPEPAEADQ